MDKQKIVIKKADMPEEMQEFAKIITIQATNNYKKATEIATFIKNEFVKKYGRNWNCVAGHKFGVHVSCQRHRYINFYIGDLEVMIYKGAPTLLKKKPKIEIIMCDMTEEMQQFAIDIALQAIKDYEIENEIAKVIKDKFDEKYGRIWHGVVGNKFGVYVTHQHKCFMHFKVDGLGVTIFKGATE